MINGVAGLLRCAASGVGLALHVARPLLAVRENSPIHIQDGDGKFFIAVAIIFFHNIRHRYSAPSSASSP